MGDGRGPRPAGGAGRSLGHGGEEGRGTGAGHTFIALTRRTASSLCKIQRRVRRSDQHVTRRDGAQGLFVT